jgi:hypothetical protein
LTDHGVHVFCLPIVAGYWQEDLAPLSDDERKARFYQRDHVRNFGRKDLEQTLGRIFPIPHDYDLRRRYPTIDFNKYNIPESSLVGLNASTVFVMRKGDIKLNSSELH